MCIMYTEQKALTVNIIIGMLCHSVMADVHYSIQYLNFLYILKEHFSTLIWKTCKRQMEKTELPKLVQQRPRHPNL